MSRRPFLEEKLLLRAERTFLQKRSPFYLETDFFRNTRFSLKGSQWKANEEKLRSPSEFRRGPHVLEVSLIKSEPSRVHRPRGARLHMLLLSRSRFEREL